MTMRATIAETELRKVADQALQVITRLTLQESMLKAALSVLLKHDLMRDFSEEYARQEGADGETPKSDR